MTSNRPHIIICRPDGASRDTFARYQCTSGEWQGPMPGPKKLQTIIEGLLFTSPDPERDVAPLAGNIARKLPAHPANTWPNLTITPRSASLVKEVRNLMTDDSFARASAWSSVTILMPQSDQAPDRWHQVIRERDGFGLGPKETRFQQQRLGAAVLEFLSLEMSKHFIEQSAEDPMTELWVRPDWRAVDFVPDDPALKIAPPNPLAKAPAQIAPQQYADWIKAKALFYHSYTLKSGKLDDPAHIAKVAAALTAKLGRPVSLHEARRLLARFKEKQRLNEGSTKNRTQGEPSVSSWRP